MTQVQAPTPGAPSDPDAAKPTFDALQLSPDVRKALGKMGYVHPTPVQLAVFEPATRGKSLVVQARTGTGKTTAFGLPIVDGLVKKSVAGVQALILTPTRELAIQVAKELELIAEFRGVKILPIYGGAPMGRQVEALAEGVQIVSGTPGRVLDHLRRGTLDPSNVRIFVLDEADEMLSMGFAKELNAIIEMLPKERQGLYFSATIPPDVERLANSHLHNPEYVTLSSDQVGALSISHFVYLVREGDKRASLVRIIEVEDPESAVVFCNTKDETERVAEALKNAGYDAEWLNGDLEQRERERIMAKTKEGKLRFLVATDVAARGIDISHLTHVINADFPESAEQYVHRTGRTGRAGRTGTAISIVGPKDVGHLYMLRLTYKIRPIERTLPTKGELRTRQETDLIAFLADAYAARTPDPMHLAVARRLLTSETAETIVSGLLADHLGASSNEDVSQQAADARRAKNPPAEPAPAPAPTRHARPEVRREGREARREAPRDARPAQAPQAQRPARDGEAAPERGQRDFGRRQDRPFERRDGDNDRARSDRGRPERTERTEPRAQRPLDRDRDRDRQRSAAPAPRSTPQPTSERQPQAALSDWQPPADADDDHPIFQGTPSRNVGRSEARRPERPRRNERFDRPRHGGGYTIGYTVEGESPEARAESRPESGQDSRQEARPDSRREARPDSRRESRQDFAPRTHDGGEATDGADVANIFVNVGRRDGLKPGDVQTMLQDGGITDFDSRNVRVRERITFVTVRKTEMEQAIRALVGQVVGGRTVNAEPARG